MPIQDPEAVARNQRVQGLCRELGQLVELSREQRRVIDVLLGELEAVLRRARMRRLARGAARTAGSSG
jgi:hypothetical protein